MVYLKSLELACCWYFAVRFVSMFVTASKRSTSTAVSIDIRNLSSPGLWIPAALLFLIGFFFEFRSEDSRKLFELCWDVGVSRYRKKSANLR